METLIMDVVFHHSRRWSVTKVEDDGELFSVHPKYSNPFGGGAFLFDSQEDALNFIDALSKSV